MPYLQEEGTVFQIGIAPRRIDIITEASGLKFDKAYNASISLKIEGIEVRILSIEDLILNKKAAGRAKDLADAETLESLKRP